MISGPIMIINVCIYIYIYIWMYVCGYLSVFVDGWPKKESYLRHFLPASECLEGSLCLFWREDHSEDLRDWKKRTKDVGQSGVRLRSREFGSMTRVQNCRRAVWSQERRHRAVRTMTR